MSRLPATVSSTAFPSRAYWAEADKHLAIEQYICYDFHDKHFDSPVAASKQSVLIVKNGVNSQDALLMAEPKKQPSDGSQSLTFKDSFNRMMNMFAGGKHVPRFSRYKRPRSPLIGWLRSHHINTLNTRYNQISESTYRASCTNDI